MTTPKHPPPRPNLNLTYVCPMAAPYDRYLKIGLPPVTAIVIAGTAWRATTSNNPAWPSHPRWLDRPCKGATPPVPARYRLPAGNFQARQPAPALPPDPIRSRYAHIPADPCRYDSGPACVWPGRL